MRLACATTWNAKSVSRIVCRIFATVSLQILLIVTCLPASEKLSRTMPSRSTKRRRLSGNQSKMSSDQPRSRKPSETVARLRLSHHPRSGRTCRRSRRRASKVQTKLLAALRPLETSSARRASRSFSLILMSLTSAWVLSHGVRIFPLSAKPNSMQSSRSSISGSKTACS